MFSGGTATVMVGVDPVAFGSITKPLIDELELAEFWLAALVVERDDVNVDIDVDVDAESIAELVKLVVMDDTLVLVAVLDACVLVVG